MQNRNQGVRGIRRSEVERSLVNTLPRGAMWPARSQPPGYTNGPACLGDEGKADVTLVTVARSSHQRLTQSLAFLANPRACLQIFSALRGADRASRRNFSEGGQAKVRWPKPPNSCARRRGNAVAFRFRKRTLALPARQEPAGTHHARDSTTHPRGRRVSRQTTRPGAVGGATAPHCRHAPRNTAVLGQGAPEGGRGGRCLELFTLLCGGGQATHQIKNQHPKRERSWTLPTGQRASLYGLTLIVTGTTTRG